ncbi:MAG: apolipoprotein N-acyltransferase, partial [Armatimonadota bacterium]|nr:apolipoprotein N-acyltransferase [Armatimonadota bacterium]
MAIRLMGAVVSGLLLWAAFPPLDRGALVWVALVPLLWSLRGTTPREAFRLGYTSGAVWFALTL